MEEILNQLKIAQLKQDLLNNAVRIESKLILALEIAEIMTKVVNDQNSIIENLKRQIK
ncbi:hypothetical protein [Pedobacter sp. KBW01]|uniref:hypothetical protein n=1 Tax=Pedobacter sp. KBW01 TaxID=2153364 RepID=UPI00131A121D|nr:hypothetical protein [Pedobacter sp. KBW01]